MTTTNHDSRKWSRKKLLKFSLFTTLLLLLLLEIVFRIVFYFDYSKYHTSVYIQGNSIQKEDDSLLFMNRPFYVDYSKRYQFNEEGMKCELGDVFIPQKEENDFWVFLFGGSAMEGTGALKSGDWFDIDPVDDHIPAETIGGYLQKILQQQMPGKKVKVFSAANPAHAAFQSMKRYELLRKKYKIDWVISLDGQNDPASLTEGESALQFVQKDWATNPKFEFPLKAIIPVTSHSALATYMKLGLFRLRLNMRISKDSSQHFPLRTKWGNATPTPIKYAVDNKNVDRAVDSFYHQLFLFDSILALHNQKHLLLIQPHISLRDVSKTTFPEKAIFNYYSGKVNDAERNSFIKSVHDGFYTRVDTAHKKLISMYNMVFWNQQVFVDYCHFTAATNERIAGELARYIISDGKHRIFTKE